MLNLNWQMIWTFVNILILYFLLKKFLFKPVADIMDKRAQQIDDLREAAQTEKEDAEKLKAQYASVLDNAGKEAAAIIADAQKTARAEYEKIIKTAQNDASAIIEKANKAIELERQKVISEAAQQMTGIALAAAAKLVQRNIDESSNHEFLDGLLLEVGAEHE
ncbi:MAG: F0F1 ATP synthase subunit B [Clostridia bacterium]|nr:F0F1 ATP synthase subunit B [Clostridia bacterium]